MLGVHYHSCPNIATSADIHREGMNLDDADAHLLYRFSAIFANHLNQSTEDKDL